MPKSKLLPPTVSLRSRLRGVSVNSEGALPIHSITMSRPMRTFSPSTVQPSLRRISTASGCRNSIPISSRIRMAPSWMASTPSGPSGSTGRSMLTGGFQGICSITVRPRRSFAPARPPPRLPRLLDASAMSSSRCAPPEGPTERRPAFPFATRSVVFVVSFGARAYPANWASCRCQAGRHPPAGPARPRSHRL